MPPVLAPLVPGCGTVTSCVTEAVAVAESTAAVETTLKPDLCPDAVLQTTDEPDVHVVLSWRVSPTRSNEDLAICDTANPTIVTLQAPVVATLTPTTLLGDTASNVNIDVTVPDCMPTVPMALRERPTPWLDLLIRELSERHKVDCTPVDATRPIPLNDDHPKSDPTIVTDVEPVLFMFVRADVLITLLSYECRTVVVLTSFNTETPMQSTDETPPATLQPTVESETHVVDSPALHPSLSREDQSV
jgi:hypothetical protein